MNLFPYHKSVNVGTYNLQNDIIPKFMYKDLIPVNENKFGCPAVGSLNKRMYEMNSMFDIEIEFGFNKEKPYFKYKFPTDTYKDVPEVHKVLNYKISTLQSSSDVLTLQFIIDTVFVTDNKKLEIITLPSLDNLKTENCRYVSGTYHPYGWIRNLNASWILINKNKPAYVKLSMDKPLLTFLFNMPVNIKEIKPTQEMLDYHKYMYEIVTYRSKIKKIFPHILSKRPHKFL